MNSFQLLFFTEPEIQLYIEHKTKYIKVLIWPHGNFLLRVSYVLLRKDILCVNHFQFFWSVWFLWGPLTSHLPFLPFLFLSLFLLSSLPPFLPELLQMCLPNNGYSGYKVCSLKGNDSAFDLLEENPSWYLKFRIYCLPACLFLCLLFIKLFVFTKLLIYWAVWHIYWARCLHDPGSSRRFKIKYTVKAPMQEGISVSGVQEPSTKIFLLLSISAFFLSGSIVYWR